MTEPLVSIIIPTYNQAAFLKECLDSVRAQTYPSWEAIVVNNFSDDDTIAVVSGFNDPQIRLINFRNQGIIAASRNQAIQAARGHYIAFLDSDDIWFKEKLENQIKAFSGDSSLMMVCSNGYWYNNATRLKRRIYRTVTNNRISYRKQLWSNRIVNSTVMIKKLLVDKIGLLDENPLMAGCEDYDYWLRVLKEQDDSVLVLCRPLVLIREHGSNISNLFYGTANTLSDRVVRIYKKYEASDPVFIAKASRRMYAITIKISLYRGIVSLGQVLRMKDISIGYKIDIVVRYFLRRAIYGAHA